MELVQILFEEDVDFSQARKKRHWDGVYLSRNVRDTEICQTSASILVTPIPKYAARFLSYLMPTDKLQVESHFTESFSQVHTSQSACRVERLSFKEFVGGLKKRTQDLYAEFQPK